MVSTQRDNDFIKAQIVLRIHKPWIKRDPASTAMGERTGITSGYPSKNRKPGKGASGIHPDAYRPGSGRRHVKTAFGSRSGGPGRHHPKTRESIH